MGIKKTHKGYTIDVSLGYDPIAQKQRRIRKSNIKTKAEAEHIASYYKQQYFQNNLVTNLKVTFNQIGDKYFANYTVDQKPTYIRTQKGYYNHRILPYFKETQVSKIEKKDCIKFRDELLNEDVKTRLSSNSINKHMILLKKLFDVAIDDNLIVRNPCIGIKKLKVVKQKMKFWTTSEFKRFISAIDEKDFVDIVFFTTAYLTGMRAGEMLALQWEDIDFGRNEIHVSKTMSRVSGENIVTTPKSTNSNRYITINAKLAEMLKDWKKRQESLLRSYLITDLKDITVFQYSINTPIRECFGTKKIKKICKEAELTPIRLHDFRHSHVALLIDNKEEITAIKERMGHASITTTIDTYGHLFPNKQKSMSDKFDDLI
ncbi:tyrosine-type recombinase/integrase [Listeria booriae]|uniref:tyrosine-type recombinase/integrase n=1 Tax=Listeria booriae TaxID=1552123 RepID=UPI0016268A70|nr:site-specific integrase [Listeria booriae]MBC1358312.1 site-specific integrase [Listeria booriae]